MTQDDSATWRVSGSYFEACNCDAICPTLPTYRRSEADDKASTYGVCQFALSWLISRGHHGPVDLAGRAVVLAGFYRDAEPGKPWSVCLYVDDQATEAQYDTLTAMFLGRLGGAPARNFALKIAETLAVCRAEIVLDHRPGRWLMRASDFVRVKATSIVASEAPVSCGIPGHDHPGDEVRVEHMHVAHAPLAWECTAGAALQPTSTTRIRRPPVT